MYDDTCWVYVVGNPGHTFRAIISVDGNIPESELVEKGEELMLRHRFDDVVSAGGFRMALEKLSPDSVRQFVKLKSEHNEI